MSREEQIKGAIVVFPDAIGYASPEMNYATEQACCQLIKFMDYIQELHPQLERHEAIIIGTAVLEALPALFENNPEMIAGIKTESEAMRAKRP